MILSTCYRDMKECRGKQSRRKIFRIFKHKYEIMFQSRSHVHQIIIINKLNQFNAYNNYHNFLHDVYRTVFQKAPPYLDEQFQRFIWISQGAERQFSQFVFHQRVFETFQTLIDIGRVINEKLIMATLWILWWP